jgi:hypothetical protein
MPTQSVERRNGTPHRRVRFLVLLGCIGALAACAGRSTSEGPPATAATEPEPNSVIEKDRQMPFSRESPAPDPEVPATPQGAATQPTPGASPTLQPTGENRESGHEK